MVEQLFDISAKDFEMKLRRDESMPCDTSALQEDLAFLDDQRTNRNMIISSKIETELEARFQRKIDRCKRKEEYKDRVQKSNDSIIHDNKEKIGEKRQWNHNFFPNNDINFSFASEDPTEPKKTRAESQLEFHRKVMFQLAEIKNILVNKTAQFFNDPEGYKQLKSSDEVNVLKRKIANGYIQYITFVKQLSLIGGKNSVDTIKNVLLLLTTDTIFRMQHEWSKEEKKV
ncbi:uncharacterized protein LOC105850515 isoform X2 [Hydra vulgaris]|uniref:uncharacterized protein LOC105850515 isoform X2 n=1 Tax=Hydra vulgaris TaxID=6087 RepID=UPI001F5F37DF|nr:uncharacterized protein LOC105850515 isoform X1 [Hydra vulgaris]